MPESQTNLTMALNKLTLPLARALFSSLSAHRQYLPVVAVLSALFLAKDYSNPEQVMLFLGALCVSLTLVIGFGGLLMGMSLTLAIQFYWGHLATIPETFASLLFLSSLTLIMLLRYYNDAGKIDYGRVLSNVKETEIFIALAAIAAGVSTGLFVVSGNFVAEQSKYALSDFGTLALDTAITIICICPLFTLWKRQNKWPELPQNTNELVIWCFALTFTAFVSLSFGREWLLLEAALLLWASTRFNWFCACLALAITTLFVDPTVQSSSAATANVGIIAWAIQNIELIFWLALCVVCLYLAALNEQNEQIHDGIEQRVQKRTDLLSEMNRDLKNEIQTRIATEKALAKTNKRYRALIETAGIPVIALDSALKIKHWNAASEAVTGYGYRIMLGRQFLELCIPSEQHEMLQWRLKKAEKSKVNQENVETSLITSSNETRSMLWNISYVAEEDIEEHGQFLLIGQDISHIRTTQDQLHYLAHFDSLTGAANRRLFEDRCKQSIESARRYNTSLALISLDIDHFKAINDSLGHDGGDEFLIELARRCQNSVRKEDTVARLGGDEFVLLLPTVSGQEGADLVARNLLENITRPVVIKGHELIITSSIGITICPDDGIRYEDLLRNADLALYRAKRAGRNNIQFFSADMNNEMIRQKQIASELRQAIAEHQLNIHYQPIVDTTSGEVVALEALIRWHHPSNGVLLPDSFLTVAEQTGLIQQIGDWAIHQVCADSVKLKDRYTFELPITFNVTKKQYQHPLLIKSMRNAFEANQFNPQKLIIELSESTLTQSGDTSLDIATELKETGCSIAIDGFGKGASSLHQLNSLPIDIIKIDRGLIHHATRNTRDRMIVETILTIAKQLKLTSFAAGVETKEQETLLQRHGCHYAQGFLYSEPLEFDALCEYLSKADQDRTGKTGDQITLPFN